MRKPSAPSKIPYTAITVHDPRDGLVHVVQCWRLPPGIRFAAVCSMDLKFYNIRECTLAGTLTCLECIALETRYLHSYLSLEEIVRAKFIHDHYPSGLADCPCCP